jgi:DNA invertase Pin-like site-specific DNA recombinase
MLSLTTFADELEREKARQRTRDAMQRKAHAGHVTGGWCFGYRNVDVAGADGKRSHARREIDPLEADVVRRIFRLSAMGRCTSCRGVMAPVANASTGAPASMSAGSATTGPTSR